MSNVTFDVIARDRASATFRKVGTETQTLGSKLKTLVATAGLATLGYEALRFGKDAVKAFTDAETAQTRLADAFHRFPALADVTIGSLRDLNMALEAKTGADHNALASGEAVLAGFKLTGEQIRQIIPLVDDYAAKTGQDIPTAATALGRAFLGNTRALKSIGIEFKATGNTAQDFATITGLLQAKLGGFATREGKTAAGQLKILQAQFRDVEEELGAALLPTLVDLGHFLLRDVIPPIKTTAEYLKDNKDVIEPLAKALLVGVAAWKSYVIWTRLATASNALFTRSTVTTTAAAALGASRIAAVGAGSAVSAGTAIGGGMAARLNTANVGLANSAVLAAKNIGLMGASALGFWSFINNPRSLGFPFGFATSEMRPGGTGVNFNKQGHAVTESGKPFHTDRILLNSKGQVVDIHGNLTGQTQKEALAADAAKKLAAAETGVASTTTKATSSIGQQTKALIGLQSKALAVSQGQDDLRAAIHNMAVVAAGQSSRALRGNSDAALANRDALRGAVSSAEAYIQTLKTQGVRAGRLHDIEKTLATAIHKNAVETYGNKTAVDQLLGSLSFMPGEIQAIINKYDALHRVWFTAANLAQTLAELGPLPGYAAHAKQKKAGQDAGSSFSDGYTPVVTAGVADATTKAADAAQAAFDRAKSKMQADTQTILGFFRQTKQELISTFSTFQTSGTDILGGAGLNTNFHAQLKQGATAMHTFAHLWHRLDDLGLDPRLLAQFTGPDYIPAMREILQSGRKGIRRDNRLERGIARDARGIAQTATDDRYGRLLHHDLETFPRKLSREMVKDLHHAKFVVEFDTGKHDRHNGRKVRQHR